MQVTETAASGLKREYRVVVPATDLAAKVDARLGDLKGKVQLRGFRPGKVPVSHLKRIYGKAAMAEVIEDAVREANTKIVTDNGYKLATEPKVVPDEGAVENVIEGKADLAYKVEIEILPPIPLTDFKTIKLERLTAEVTKGEVDQAVQRVAEQNRPFGPKTEAAAKGDRVTVSFQGTIDGQPFEGGAAENVPILLGSAQFAKTLGLESLAKLREGVKERLQREYAGVSRQKLKRALLDQLDQRHKFEPPPSLLEQEFNTVWGTIEGDLKAQGRTFADEGTTEEKAREEYRGIAERRVRLGLVLAEIGEKNNIKVTDEQLTAAVMDRARQVPGQEQQVWDYYRNNPGALAGLRAPIFEEKVVDFLLELGEVTEKPVSREELFKEDEE